MTALPAAATVVARTERLVLRTWTAADVDPIAALWCDPVVMQHAGALADRAAVERALAAATRVQTERGCCLWAVDERATGRLVGDCGFHLRPGGVLELAYHFLPAAQGRGLATEAAQAAIEYGFGVLGAPSIVAWVAAANPASARVLRRCGFVDEGPDPAEGDELRHTLARPR